MTSLQAVNDELSGYQISSDKTKQSTT